jgi:uncharacterized protein YcfL
MKLSFLTFACAVSLLLGIGCASVPQKMTLTVSREGVQTSVADTSALNYVMVSRNPIMVKIPSGKKKAQMALTNIKDKPIEIHYLFTWFDKNGIEINSQSEWQPITLIPGLDTVLEDVCLSSSAEDFDIKISIPTK